MKVELNAREALLVMMEVQRIMRHHGLSLLQAQVVLLVASGRAASVNKIAELLGSDRHPVQRALRKIEDFIARDAWGALVLTDAGRALVDKLRGSCFTLTKEEDLWDRS